MPTACGGRLLQLPNLVSGIDSGNGDYLHCVDSQRLTLQSEESSPSLLAQLRLRIAVNIGPFHETVKLGTKQPKKVEQLVPNYCHTWVYG